MVIFDYTSKQKLTPKNKASTIDAGIEANKEISINKFNPCTVKWSLYLDNNLSILYVCNTTPNKKEKTEAV